MTLKRWLLIVLGLLLAGLLSVGRCWACKIEIDVDTDDDGTIEASDDPIETNSITAVPPGPYVNLNNDSDDGDTTRDRDEDQVNDEDDLRDIPVDLTPAGLDEGTVTLERSNAKVRVWSNWEKGTDNKVLYDNNTKVWDLSIPAQRTEFQNVCDSLYAEGYAEAGELGECVITAIYKNAQQQEVARDTIKLTVVPGPPQLYAGWDAWSLIMAGGQLHSQWKHFSPLAYQQPSEYRVYIDTSNQANNPFEGRTIPQGVTLEEFDLAGNYAMTEGYTYKIDETPMGAFYIHFPARGDADGTKYWVLVRSYDANAEVESQNSLAYMVVVDYPDRKGAGDATDRKDPSELNFYVVLADETEDVFIYENVCSDCANDVTDDAYAFRWRVDRAPRRNYDAGDTGSYYSSVKTDFTSLKGDLEGDGKVFDTTKGKFGGDYTDTDDDKFFVLVSELSMASGYSWTDKDLLAPWEDENPDHPYFSKSNYADMIYLDNISNIFLPIVSAHELQHNIHGNPEGGDTDEMSWINEACSKLSEETNFPLEGYSMGLFATIPVAGDFTNQGRYSLCSLNQHGATEVYLRWGKCPSCMYGDPNGWALTFLLTNYDKAAMWGHYLDKVIGPDATIGYDGATIADIVDDDFPSFFGIDDHLKKPLLTMQGTPPQCGFVNWTIANYCNQFDAAPTKYKYEVDSGWHNDNNKPAVTPYDDAATTRNSYQAVDRQLRNLAADYIQYDFAEGDDGTLVITLKHVSDSSLWTNLEVHAVRLKGNVFVDAQRLTTTDEGNEREYEVPGAWGTGGGDDYSKAVIIITDLTDTYEAAFKKTYNIKANKEE